MWTETFYYLFPDKTTADALAVPEYTAIDHVGVIDGVSGWHVNVRWPGEEAPDWATYRIPDPVNPVRVFA